MKKIKRVVLAVLAFMFTFSLAASRPQAAEATTTPAQQAFALVNAERKAQGLTELTWSSVLAKDGEVRAKELEKLYSHTRPDGSAWYTVDEVNLYGENLAKDVEYDSASIVVGDWMASPAHKANILDGGFKTAAIGYYVADNGAYCWALEFGY